MNYPTISGFNKIEHGSDIIIYGTGLGAKSLFLEIKKRRKDLHVKAFVDSYKDSGELFSIPIINVLEIKSFAKCEVIIASMYYDDIGKSLIKNGREVFYVYRETSRWNELYDSFCSINLKKLCIVDKLPISKSIYYVFNLGIDVEKDVVFNELDINGLSEGSFSYTNADDGMNYEAFREYNKDEFTEICIVDFGGEADYLADLARHIISEYNENVLIYKIPARLKLCFIEESKKLLYIKMPKTGGTSTANIFDQISNRVEKELPNRVYKDVANCVDASSPFFDEYKKFTVVRNPYLRLASLYAHLIRSEESFHVAHVFRKKLKSFDFATFCKFVATCPDEFSEIHFKSQTSYLSTSEGLIKDLYLVRLENYENEMKVLFADVGEEIDVPHKNRSRPKKGNYLSDYYTPELIKIVNERYEEDFINFGYEFL
ncbi:sulfotransferase family 2 domain-containing protein [Maridesulfovibrio frigidus]|uniref:sulfotransferase family 2 domain-containing protein n=1 Tax=Maridesulfovibrio frigidus TaxID=340956 RepID=UPI0004E2473D|nr:sulfotransferase family 2 domain-containing protein [Maridesulfovibrio frigidus]